MVSTIVVNVSAVTKPEGRRSFFIIYFSRNVLDKNVLLFISLQKILSKNADFLYDTIETYIKDAEKANKSELVEILQTIKLDRKKHVHMLKEALKKRFMDKTSCLLFLDSQYHFAKTHNCHQDRGEG